MESWLFPFTDDVQSAGAPLAPVLYDARELPTPGLLDIWPNAGTLGASWDVVATGTARPTLEADSGNGVPSVFFSSIAQQMRMAAGVVSSWPTFQVGMVISSPNSASRCALQWNENAGSVFRNSIITFLTGVSVVTSGTGTINLPDTYWPSWIAIAIDLTTPTAPVVSVNGGSPVVLSPGAVSLLTPERVTLGTGYPTLAGWNWNGGRIGLFEMQNVAQDLQAWSARLKTAWNF